MMMLPDQFFDLIEAKRQAQATALAQAKAEQEAEQNAAYAQIREVAKTFMPDFLAEQLSFDPQFYDGHEECAELRREEITGIRIFFRLLRDQWAAGKEYSLQEAIYRYPYHYRKVNAHGGMDWVSTYAEEFTEVWILAASEQEKQRALEVQAKPDADQPLLDTAFTLDGASTHYRIEFSPTQALKFIQRADPQSECWSREPLAFLQAINQTIPAMQFGAGNPNNGKPHHRFFIGREFTRVIYLDMAMAYLENTVEDLPALIEKISQLGFEYHAQESAVYEQSAAGILFRFWWKRCQRCEE